MAVLLFWGICSGAGAGAGGTKLKVTCAICERILDKIKHYIETCLGYPVPICSDCYIRYHQAAPGGYGVRDGRVAWPRGG